MATPILSSRVRFGVFEVDLRAGELRKQGIKIKLHDQPFKVLAILLEHPGEVVTREQICQRLWPADTFVDSEVGLNSAVKKLRDALGDSAENPRFLETLPRRGYRLIVPVKHLQGAADPHWKESASFSAVDQPTLEADLSPGNGAVVAGQQKIVLEATARPATPRLATSVRGKVAVVAVVLAVLAVGVWWRFWPLPTHQYSIAVLPLRNLSPEPGSDYFSDGLTDEIISNLSLIDGLEVKSRTSSFTFRDKARDIHSVGGQLGAKLILEGSVLRSGDKLRVNVQLFRVADDVPIWSGRYDRELKDVFEVQDEISRSIVNELRLNLRRGQRRYNTNLEAYDLYLRARSLVNRTPGYYAQEIAQSIPLFQAAIAKDPSFAPAYAGIADAYAYLSATPRTFNPETAYAEMRVACPKALQLDPLLAEAYACMGLIDSRDHNWGEAERAFRRAIELNPNLSRPREDFATWMLIPLGRLDESERELRTAIELDPLSPRAVNSLDFLLVIAGRYDEVLSNSRRVLASDPENYPARQLLARAWVQKGDLQEGIATLEKLGGSDSFLAYAYAKAGRRAETEQIAAKHPDWPWLQALVYAGLGDKDKALDGLRKMAANKDPRAGIYLLYPEFAFLRGDPRLNDIRQGLGLPEVR
jgi:TolB-like protein/DNA-binding winged helix-turn-helix (wHTH) protein/cytochrome c-type biogenesis protein CcmH/NrfG